jgi:hypothetical protein
MGNDNEIIENIANKEYEFGFVTDIEMDILPAGLDEDTSAVGERHDPFLGVRVACGDVPPGGGLLSRGLGNCIKNDARRFQTPNSR